MKRTAKPRDLFPRWPFGLRSVLQTIAIQTASKIWGFRGSCCLRKTKISFSPQRKRDRDIGKTHKFYLARWLCCLKSATDQHRDFTPCGQGQLPKLANGPWNMTLWMRNVSAHYSLHWASCPFPHRYIAGVCIEQDSKDVSLALKDQNLPTAIAQEVEVCTQSIGVWE